MSDESNEIISRFRSCSVRRGGISSDVLTEDDASKFKKNVIPKSEKVLDLIKQAFTNNTLLSRIEDAARNEIIDVMVKKTYQCGDRISLQDHGENEYFFVIESGIVECLVDNVVNKELTQGEMFGECNLLYCNADDVTYRAKTDVDLWGVDRTTYRLILISFNIRKRNKYAQYIFNLPLLKNLNDREKQQVLEMSEAVSYVTEQTVVREGDVDTNVYIILEGSASLRQKNNESNQEIEVKKLGPSDLIEESEFLTRRPRRSTVVAEDNLVCLKFDGEKLEEIVGPGLRLLTLDLNSENSENGTV